MQKSICFNARNVVYGSGGTSKWSKEVLRSLQSNPRVEIRTVAPSCAAFGSGLGGYFWEQFILPFHLKSNEILFSPANLGPLLVRRQVLVIHDLLPILNPDEFNRTYIKFIRFLYHGLIRRVRLVLTVSDEVREQILEIYGIAAERIFVVGGGVTPREKISSPSGKPSDLFCLLVGGHIHRKNLRFLLTFWEEIYLHSGCRLVTVVRVTGDRALSSVQNSQSQGAVWYSEVSEPTDEELTTLYESARFILQPSTGEGFGLPILEGMNCGTPFLSNTVGIARNLCVGESRAIGLDRAEWISYLTQRTKHPKDYDESITLREFAHKYSWNSVALKILEILS